MKQQITSLITGPALPRFSLWLALLVVLTMPVYPFITTWLGTFVAEPNVLKVVKDIALGLMAIGLLIWLVKDSQRRQVISRDAILWLLLGLVVVSFFVTVWATQAISESLLVGVLANGRYLAVFFLVYASLRYGEVKLNLAHKALPFLSWVGVGLAVIGILQVFVLPLDTLEYFGYEKDVTIAPYTLIDDNPDAPRAFATLRGPNDYGAYLLITAVAATLMARRDKRWLIGVALIVLAMVLSSSRSAWLGLVVALLALVVVFYNAVSSRAKKMIRLGVYVSAIIGTLLLLAATTIPALQLAIFHSSPDDPHIFEGSTEQHWIATGEGINRVLEEPLGCGVGCSGPASFYSDSPKVAENYFVQIAEEVGLIGLAIWIGLFGLIMVRLWRHRSDHLALLVFSTGIGLSVVGVWLHVWYDDPISLTWWALAGLAVANSYIVEGKKRRDHERPAK